MGSGKPVDWAELLEVAWSVPAVRPDLDQVALAPAEPGALAGAWEVDDDAAEHVVDVDAEQASEPGHQRFQIAS